MIGIRLLQWGTGAYASRWSPSAGWGAVPARVACKPYNVPTQTQHSHAAQAQRPTHLIPSPCLLVTLNTEHHHQPAPPPPPLQKNKLPPAAQRAGQRAPVEALVRPEEDKPAELQEQHATDAIVTDMLRVLRALPGGTSPLLELVLDPHPEAGFAQTVENLFALSFLVK